MPRLARWQSLTTVAHARVMLDDRRQDYNHIRSTSRLGAQTHAESSDQRSWGMTHMLTHLTRFQTR